MKLWLHEYFRYEAISILDKFRCLTCGRFVHKQKSSFCFFELVLDSLISKSEFKEKKEKIEKELTNIKENVFIKSEFLNDDLDNFKTASYVKLEKCEIEKMGNLSAKISISLSLGSASTQCVSLHETGISQAQVSRLEKSAIDRMKKYI